MTLHDIAPVSAFSDLGAAGKAFGSSALDLLCRGISPIPIKPGTKRPGYLLLGNPQPYQWGESMRTLPDYDEVRCLTAGVVEAEVAVALGPVSGGLVAVDFDYEPAPGVFEKIKAVLPACEIGKRGAKGFTLFFRSDDIVNKAKWSNPADRHVIVEVLTRGQYTVVPPSVHPDTGKPYTWLDAEKTLVNVPLADLPTLTLADLAKIDALMVELGYAPAEKPAPVPDNVAPVDGGVASGDPFRQANDAARADFDSWVWELSWPVRPVRCSSYIKAVPFWRPNKNGLQPHQRTPSLSFGSGGGIMDNSAQRSMTPLDVVIAAQGMSQSDALTWLQGRLGIVVEPAGDDGFFAGLDAKLAKIAREAGESCRASQGSDSQAPGQSASTGSQGNLVVNPKAWQTVPYRSRMGRKAPRRVFFYDGFISPGLVSLTSAETKVGKSYLTITEAIEMATGRAIMRSAPAEPITVLWINLEDELNDVFQRIEGCMQRHGITDEELGDRLHVAGVEEFGGQLVLAQGGKGATVNTAILARLEAKILEIGAKVITLDPLVKMNRADENDSGVVDSIITGLNAIAVRHQCAFHLVHHISKPPQGQNRPTIHSARGSGALPSAVRFARSIVRMPYDTAVKWGVPTWDAKRLRAVIYQGANHADDAGGDAFFLLKPQDVLDPEQGNLPVYSIGAVERFDKPKDEISDDDGKRVLALRMGAKEARKDVQSADWIGYAIAFAFGIEGEPKKAKGEIDKRVRRLVSEGFLEECEARAHGRPVPALRIAKGAQMRPGNPWDGPEIVTHGEEADCPL